MLFRYAACWYPYNGERLLNRQQYSTGVLIWVERESIFKSVSTMFGKRTKEGQGFFFTSSKCSGIEDNLWEKSKDTNTQRNYLHLRDTVTVQFNKLCISEYLILSLREEEEVWKGEKVRFSSSGVQVFCVSLCVCLYILRGREEGAGLDWFAGWWYCHLWRTI